MAMRSISAALAAGCVVLALSGCNRAAPAGAASSGAPAASVAAASPTSPSPAQTAPTAQAIAAADTLPTQVGQCVQTTVKSVGTRLEGTPGSGSAIEYADGGGQVSYDQVLGIDDSKAGDSVRLCLDSLPQDCPAGDDRGKVYSGTNLRTGETWTEADSEHSCGGA